jgi:hypothetical protein
LKKLLPDPGDLEKLRQFTKTRQTGESFMETGLPEKQKHGFNP